MDRPMPTIHEVPFSLMGVMAPIAYQSGDWVRYGGMLYKPEGAGGLMVHVAGDYHASGGSAWGGQSGQTRHLAQIWINGDKSVFYCS